MQRLYATTYRPDRAGDWMARLQGRQAIVVLAGSGKYPEYAADQRVWVENIRPMGRPGPNGDPAGVNVTSKYGPAHTEESEELGQLRGMVQEALSKVRLENRNTAIIIYGPKDSATGSVLFVAIAKGLERLDEVFKDLNVVMDKIPQGGFGELYGTYGRQGEVPKHLAARFMGLADPNVQTYYNWELVAVDCLPRVSQMGATAASPVMELLLEEASLRMGREAARVAPVTGSCVGQVVKKTDCNGNRALWPLDGNGGLVSGARMVVLLGTRGREDLCVGTRVQYEFVRAGEHADFDRLVEA